jgi:hypothetical protein
MRGRQGFHCRELDPPAVLAEPDPEWRAAAGKVTLAAVFGGTVASIWSSPSSMRRDDAHHAEAKLVSAGA